VSTFGPMWIAAIAFLATVADAPVGCPRADASLGAIATRIGERAAHAAASATESFPPPAPASGLERPVHSSTHAGLVFLPRGFHLDEGAFDVIVHFHGAPTVLEDALEAAGLHAALLTVNLGIGSGPYEDTYADTGALGRAVAAVALVVERTTSAAPHVRRIALSSFSAGYGAVSRILSSERASAGVDAVLLSDGLHAGFTSAKAHTLDDRKMAPFVRFASDAARGEKLMGITHSAIETYDYASTTETAAYLLHEVRLEPTAGRSVGARGMIMTSVADRGGLHVRGFAGTTKEAHCDQLLSIGDNLFPFLAQRWP